MPSKKKKNRRRQKRLEILKRTIEERQAANPQAKGSPAIAVCAPPAAIPKNVAPAPAPVQVPAPAPEKIPEPVPVAVPIVETPKEPEPVVPTPEPVEVEVIAPEPEPEAEPEPEPEPAPVLLEETEAEVADIEVPAPVTEEEPALEAPTFEVSVEPVIPEPEIEVVPAAEAPVEATAETEVPPVDTTFIETEIEQTHEVCEAETEVEAPAADEPFAVVEIEVVVSEDNVAPEPVPEVPEEPAAEVPVCEELPAETEPTQEEEDEVTQTVTESASEDVLEVRETEQVAEIAVCLAPPPEGEEDEGEVEVLAEGDAPEVPAEDVAITEDVPVQSVETPELPAVVPEVLAEEAAPIIDAQQLVEDAMVEDFVVTESASAVESAIAECEAIQQETLTITDTLSMQTESMHVTPAEPEPVVAPAEAPIDAVVEQTCVELLPEEPKPQICDMACQMQLAVESVQLNSVEMSMDTALNTHIVQEVPIEG